MVSGANRTPTRWVIFFLLLLVVLFLGIIIPIQLINNPNTVNSLELVATGTAFTPTLGENTTPPEDAPPALVLIGGTVESPQQNCTYSPYFYLLHPENWPVQVIVNDLNYTKEDAIEWIETDPADIGTLLFLQFHVAYLNLLSGADPADATQAMIEASRWLVNLRSGTPLEEADYQYGMDLAAYLARFNNGQIGPGHCADEPAPSRITALGLRAPVLLMTPSWRGVFILATSAPKLTPTPTPGLLVTTRTPINPPVGGSPTSIFRPSPTATATSDRLIKPTSTRQPTATFPVVYTPTSPPAPTQAPTATQPPPTATPPPPPPTATPQPPTPVPTDPPPTSAPTERSPLFAVFPWWVVP